MSAGGYRHPMDDRNDLPPPPKSAVPGAAHQRPIWLRGAAIGMIAFLAGSVILGMFLY